MTIRELAKQFGVSRGTIASRAKRNGWDRDLSGRVKQAATAQLLRDSAASADNKADKAKSERDLVRTAAARVVEIVRQHRGTLGQLHETARKLLGVVTRYADLADKQAKARTGKGRDKFNDEMATLRAALGVHPVAALNQLTAAVERVVGMERQAFNIEDKERTADDMIPLADRLKALRRDQAIDDADNVEKLRHNGAGDGQDRGAA